MAKYGIEKLSVTIADSIIEFVGTAVSNELDNLDLEDKAQDAIDEVVQRTDLSEQLMQAIDIDSSFHDWLEARYENQIQPILDSFREDLEEVRASNRALLQALESIQNDRKSLTWTNTLLRLWSDFRALFVTVKP